MRKIINFKTLPLLFTLLFAGNAFSYDLNVKVDEYSPTDFEYMFKISNQSYSKIILDCQSFINEIRFYNKDETLLGNFMLDIQECEDIHFSILELKNEGKKSCLKLDFDRAAYAVTELDEDCK